MLESPVLCKWPTVAPSIQVEVEEEKPPEIIIKEKKEVKRSKSWGRRSTRAKKTISYRFVHQEVWWDDTFLPSVLVNEMCWYPVSVKSVMPYFHLEAIQLLHLLLAEFLLVRLWCRWQKLSKLQTLWCKMRAVNVADLMNLMRRSRRQLRKTSKKQRVEVRRQVPLVHNI